MSVRGWVQSCVWEPDGSALVASVASGGTVLSVENVGDFDDGGGEVEVNGQRITYSADAIDFTANTITLDAPGLSAAAAVDDWVSVVSGGQTVIDPILSVSLGDGEPARVVVPFEQRDKWPEGDYDPPVEVLLSDDLERLEATPGRIPSIDLPSSTVTAGLVQTATEGQRIVLTSDASGARISGYTGSILELGPTAINPAPMADPVSGGLRTSVTITSGFSSGGLGGVTSSFLRLIGPGPSGTGKASAYLDAGGGVIYLVGAVNISGAINGRTLRGWDFGNATGTVNASGDITISHNCGGVPSSIVFGNNSGGARFYTVQGAATSTTFTVRVRDNTGAALASGTAVDFFWQAMRA